MAAIIFTGFDSAWSSRKSGAICDLVLKEDGSLQLGRDPVVANWDQAIAKASQTGVVDLHVWAIDQPICLRNETGTCRPVEKDLARALMAGFGCGAHSSNLGKPCWQLGAGIWEFVRALDRNSYVHNPMEIPGTNKGRYYFECYPHPALLGVFDLDHIVKYKFHHKNEAEWRRIIDLLRSLATNELPVRNICGFVHEGLAQNKANEDKLDAIISAYTAAYWWKFGSERSTMIGDLTTGYIITPHSKRTYAAFSKVFGGRMNQQGLACGPPQKGAPFGPTAPSPVNRAIRRPDDLPMEPQNDWSNPVELKATDTSNIWRSSRRVVINSWIDAKRMTGWRLWVRFIDDDGQPDVLFEAFKEHGKEQGGMKPAEQSLWSRSDLVTGARKDNPIRFQVCYRYNQIQ